MTTKREKQPSGLDHPPPKRHAMGSTCPRSTSPRLQSEEAFGVKTERPAAHRDGEASSGNSELKIAEPSNELPGQPDNASPGASNTTGPRESSALILNGLPGTYAYIFGEAVGFKNLTRLRLDAGQNQLNRKNNGKCEVDTEEIGKEWDDGIRAIEDLTWVLAKDRKLSSGGKVMLRPRRDWNDLSPELQDELRRWTSHAKEIFEDPSRIQLLYAARIWHTIDEQLFSAGPESVREWLGPHWAKFTELKEAFKAGGHDQPWKKGDMDGIYNVWRWYTAKLLYLTFDEFPTGRIIKAVCRHIMRDLEPLVDLADDEKKFCQIKLERALGFISEVFKLTSLDLGKYWLAWQPEQSKGMWGFCVSSATDEGYNVFMKPLKSSTLHCAPDGTREGKDLNGAEVHLVLSPALATTQLYDEGPSHHYVNPMIVVVGEHLGLDGGSSPAVQDKDGPAPFLTTSTTDEGPDREDMVPAITQVEAELPLHSPTPA